MRAIVLTYAPVSDKEKRLLQKTNIFKIACNWHAEELKPDLRLVLDDKETIKKALEVGNQKVISGSYDYSDERVERVNLPRRYSTLISCCDYLILKGYKHILLVANNRQTNQKDITKSFQQLNINGINTLKEYAHIYKYSNDSVFDVATRTIEEFLTMTDENLILGTEEEKAENPLLKGLVFSDAFLFKVKTKNLNNESIESGTLIENLLPFELKNRIIAGEKTVEYNGLEITRITEVSEQKPAEEKEVKKVEKTIKKGKK